MLERAMVVQHEDAWMMTLKAGESLLISADVSCYK
jgi:hypothetical protein